MKQVYEICFGCQMSSWNMVRVANVFLRYKHWSETSFLCIGRGQNVFYKYELGAKISLNNGANWLWGKQSVHRVVGLTRHPSVCGCQLSTVCSGSNHTMTICGWQPSKVCSTLIPRATLRGVAELHEIGRARQTKCVVGLTTQQLYVNLNLGPCVVSLTTYCK